MSQSNCVEIWKDTEVNNLQVSNLGAVRVNRDGSFRTLKPTDNGHGYMRLNIKAGGKQKTLYVHRLVAAAFVANPGNRPEVNHMDGDKRNNAALNLEWVTRLGNVKHAIETGLIVLHKTPCLQMTKDGKIVKQYESYGAAASANGCFMGGIRNVCKGIRPTYKGYVWRDAPSALAA